MLLINLKAKNQVTIKSLARKWEKSYNLISKPLANTFNKSFNTGIFYEKMKNCKGHTCV